MTTQYHCGNPRRRQAVREHPTLNGIDFLEVLDREAPAGSPRQRTLLVRLLKPVPAGLDGDNVRITGGVRITNVGVVWAAPASDAPALFAAGQISEAERDFFLAQPEPDHLLLVRTDAAGDFSAYRLALVNSSTDPAPPADFDPILSAVEFGFKVECPSDFDCAPEPDCPPETVPPPPIDYLAKDYASFRQVMLDRLAVTLPAWQERSAADLGIALVELLAYAADRLSYFQDAVATEAYLGTARRRPSVRRHARLLDYPMHEGTNARTWVRFEVEAGGAGDGAILPQADPVTGLPTQLLTQVPDEPRIAPARVEEVLSRYAPEVFELVHPITLYHAHNEMPFYTWGDDDCCLPAGATRATLRDDAADRLRLRPGDVLLLEARRDPGTGEEADADPAQRHAVRLLRVLPEADEDDEGHRTPGPLHTDPLTDQPIVEIEWRAGDALPGPLCLSFDVNGTSYDDGAVARGNVALADHGRTVVGAPLPTPVAGQRYRPRLDERDLTVRVPYAARRALTRPAAEALIQPPQEALPAVRLLGDDEPWEPQRDLLNSDRFATEFVVETEADGRATLRFGDDVFGREAPTDVTLVPRYRVGNGVAGNVGAGAIQHVVTDVQGITLVTNPLPARGGVDPEPLEAVRLYAPQAFRTQARAVTEADYAAMAERHPQVQKAVATRRWTGSWHTMFVTVDRVGGRAVDADFEAELRAFLEPFRLAGHDLEIDAPRFVPLDIAMTVCVRAGYVASDVRAALRDAFSNRVLPGGTRGFFHPDALTFGQPLYLSQVVARAMQVPGVLWVDLDPANGNRFRRWGQAQHDEFVEGLIRLARLEIARLDNDPNRPENGRIEFLMEGGR